MNTPPQPTPRRSAWCTPAWGLNRVGAEHHNACQSRIERGLLPGGCICPCHEKKDATD